MDIYQGHITAIIGPSGCGKSTFIESLNRISELESSTIVVKGQVEFFGKNIYASRVNLNRLRQQIGMVFQKPSPFPMSIYDNVAYGVRIAGRCAKSKLDEIVSQPSTAWLYGMKSKINYLSQPWDFRGDNSSAFVLLVL